MSEVRILDAEMLCFREDEGKVLFKKTILENALLLSFYDPP